METSMNTLHHVFDPLCGWCDGASAAVAALAGACPPRTAAQRSVPLRHAGAAYSDPAAFLAQVTAA